mmetsp:Transcript_7510/g.9797  ORF Transcript_7510/g.9797 Transcript_7510/m.9797 type:complete len:528 (-) Transcript_7510:210-1793(-)|eukprot:CAMPEP_0198153550 /NCGR_PEP_ID=MMETSP1443-20131203/64696_1 /TAXON_ID=186043 /ORGANISM="Entomoneis sp., Strain CCMP2396" /LENGTH=527 /DNA_ID=CAMNT_0043819935 /DNA_START=89 /DNA_END=1672 /DNA_ORIENTATION=-
MHRRLPYSRSFSVFPLFSMCLFSLLTLPLKRVSAWAPAAAATAHFSSSWNQSANKIQQRRSTSSTTSTAGAPFLHVRGGGTSFRGTQAPSLVVPGHRVFSTSSTSTTLQQASVTDNNERPRTLQDSDDDSNKDDDDDNLDFYKKALAVNLPNLEFGGLSYWETSNYKNSEGKGNNNQQQQKFRVLFVLGGPGAGKGTQSALMAENYPVVHLSVGELLRDATNDPESPHRDLIQESLVAGRIVPVQISLSLLQNAMEKASQTPTSNAGKKRDDILFLVDGFPRNEDNISGWCQYMGNVASIWTTLFYACPLEVLESRILERAKNSGRSDDNLESMHKRFATFDRDTMPIIRKLSKVSHVLEIAGNQSLDDVWLATQQALNQLVRHDVLTANAALLMAVEEGDVETYKSICDALWFEKKKAHYDENDETTVATTKTSPTATTTTALDSVATIIMEKQEGKPQPIGKIRSAELEFVSGKHVVVSYTRTMQGQDVREKRVWVYEEEGLHSNDAVNAGGWRNVHFSRTPVMP